MQALHRKLDVVLVKILPYNCSETDYSFCEVSPPMQQDPADHAISSPSLFFYPTLLFLSSPCSFLTSHELSFLFLPF